MTHLQVMLIIHSPKGWRVRQGRRAIMEVDSMCLTLSMILTKNKLFQDGELKKTRMSMLIKTLTTPLVPSTTSPKKTNFS